jgi:hypothetical protein
VISQKAGDPPERPGFKLIGNKVKDPKQFGTARRESMPLLPSQTCLAPPSSCWEHFTKKGKPDEQIHDNGVLLFCFVIPNLIRDPGFGSRNSDFNAASRGRGCLPSYNLCICALTEA